MKLVARTLTLGVCLAALAGCSSAPPAKSPTPAPTKAAATATPAATASAVASASASPAASASPSASATPSESGSPSESAGGDTITNEGAGFQLTVPQGWEQHKDGEVFATGPKDGSFIVLFLAPDEDSIEGVVKDLDKLLGKFVQDVKVDGEGKESDTNGMKTFSLSGTGKAEGKDAFWTVDIIKSKKVFLMLSFGDPSKIKPNLKDIEALGDSIKPME